MPFGAGLLERAIFLDVDLLKRQRGLRFRFAEPPEEVSTLVRDGHLLRAYGSGTLTLTLRGGCTLEALPLPLEADVLGRGLCRTGWGAIAIGQPPPL